MNNIDIDALIPTTNTNTNTTILSGMSIKPF